MSFIIPPFTPRPRRLGPQQAPLNPELDLLDRPTRVLARRGVRDRIRAAEDVLKVRGYTLAEIKHIKQSITTQVGGGRQVLIPAHEITIRTQNINHAIAGHLENLVTNNIPSQRPRGSGRRGVPLSTARRAALALGRQRYLDDVDSGRRPPPRNWSAEGLARFRLKRAVARRGRPVLPGTLSAARRATELPDDVSGIPGEHGF